MLLAVDIGNTTVALGGFAGEALVFTARLPLRPAPEADACARAVADVLKEQGVAPGQLEGAVLSSVVPSLTGAMAAGLAQLTPGPVVTVDQNSHTGLPLGDYDGASLGTDRIVDCVAALARWKPPLAVFDLGTATTLSAVDGSGVFRGGLILPGLRLSLDALAQRAARLPQVSLDGPPGLLGGDTAGCMRLGALYAAVGAIEEVSRRLEEAWGPLEVVLTGGGSGYVLPLLRRAVRHEPNLQLLGLRELYYKNR